MSVLDQARALRARGLSVIPVPRPGPRTDGKVPAIAWKEFQTRHATEDEIAQWFSGPPMNLAIVTGAISGVVVVDADSKDALRWCTAHLTYTPWQVRTAKGYHLYYAHPGVPVANRARIETLDGKLAIDLRGDGGFVVGPGSVHATGVVYREAGDWTVSRDQLPRFWPGWLQKPTRISPLRPQMPRPQGDLVERARRYLMAIPVPVIGAGSDHATLYAACRLVRGFGLSSAEAETLLWDWAGGRPGWTREWIASKVAHAEKYGTEPIGALR